MKKITLLLFAILGWFTTFSQTVINDSVELGRGYVNQVFYSLKDGMVRCDTNTTWDFCFDASSRGGTIRTNGAFGVKLYLYPLGDTAAWNNVDTSQFHNWKPQYNSDTSWQIGAFNNHLIANEFDLGWGVYDINTHIVTGDSIYIVQLEDQTLKKLYIEKLRGGRYYVKYANIDGTEDTTVVIDKYDYEHKNFGYYSIRHKKQLDREPVTTSWDLSFHRYLTKLQGNVDYAVVGALVNYEVTVSEARHIDLDTIKHDDFPYNTKTNTIGHNWKSFNLDCNCYQIEDSLAYYVETANGMVYRIIFTGFSGTETGIVKFSKQWIDTSTGVYNNAKEKSFFNVYPNIIDPSANIEIAYHLQKNYGQALLAIHDLNGKKLLTKHLPSSKGLMSFQIGTSFLGKGIYFISLVYGNEKTTRKLVVR